MILLSIEILRRVSSAGILQQLFFTVFPYHGQHLLRKCRNSPYTFCEGMENRAMNEKNDASPEFAEAFSEPVTRGPHTHDAMVYRERYERESQTHMKIFYAQEYLRRCEGGYVDRKYPCPVCHSWNVSNFDPGIFRKMRVICNDCGAFRDRNGDEPWGIE